jgi:acetylornithine deacetylase/succinyl-diaminopimelate desuccinylase-like protein
MKVYRLNCRAGAAVDNCSGQVLDDRTPVEFKAGRRKQMLHARFDDAAKFVTMDAARTLLSDMVDIPSPTGRESDMAQYLVSRLSRLGIDSELQLVDEGRPNAVAHLPGTGDGFNLLFTGHMDTSYSGSEDYLVGDGFKAKPVERDGWIWGLGSMNMKSGLAGALVAVEAIAQAGIRLKGDISFGGVVGEIEKAPIEEFQGIQYSGYGAGSKHLVTHGVTADFAILAEPTGLRICTANMGCLWLRISVSGTVAHSAFRRQAGHINAIRLMTELQADLKAWIEDYEASHALMGENANVTIAAIRGGDPWRLARNPYDCHLYLDIRTVPGQSTEVVKRELRRCLKRFATRTGTPEPKISVYVTDPPMLIDEGLPVVGALADAQMAIMGNRPASIIRRPGADGTHFTRYDVPCAVFGPAGRMHPDYAGRAMHTVGEHVSLEDVLTSARIYLASALHLCDQTAPDSNR